MKLYELPRDTWFRLVEPLNEGQRMLFKRLDGAYSVCLTEDGKFIHIHANVEVEREEMNEKQQKFVERELADIKSGGCNHELFVVDHIFGLGSPSLAKVDPPVVGMSNDDDGFYVQYFNNREEIEKFIAELRAVADEAWGKE